MIDSITYAKNHRKDFLATVIAKNIASSEKKTAIFMAGAPGSGKTEVAESTFELVPNLCNINADNFRSEFPMYTGNNSSQFQKGAAYLVDYVFSWLIDHRYSFLLDGTFAIKKSSLNIKRSLDHNYNVFIYYVYQDPIVAWDFTQIREKKEGRMVPKEQFINAYFEARKNVIEAKERYGNQITLDVILKDFDNNIAEYISDVQNLNLVTPKMYVADQLKENLK